MLLKIENLSYRYKKNTPLVLKKLNLSIEENGFWFVVGPNGSGKSTFLKMLAGLVPYEGLQGTIAWNNCPIQSWTRLELAKKIAFVPGSFYTSFPISIMEFVLQGRFAYSAIWKKATEQDRSLVLSILDKVGILQLQNTLLTELSLGQLQLALIARALAQEPNVLLLDEVLAHLDFYYLAKVIELLQKLVKENKTIFLATHDLNLALEMTNHVLWFFDGTLSTQISIEDLLEKTYPEFSRKFKIGKNPFTHKSQIFWNQVTYKDLA